MRYENFDLIASKVKTIQRYLSVLERLESYGVEVVIQRRDPWCTIATIGTDSDSEHEWVVAAATLKRDILSDINNKIDKLKADLSEL